MKTQSDHDWRGAREVETVWLQVSPVAAEASISMTRVVSVEQLNAAGCPDEAQRLAKLIALPEKLVRLRADGTEDATPAFHVAEVARRRQVMQPFDLADLGFGLLVPICQWEEYKALHTALARHRNDMPVGVSRSSHPAAPTRELCDHIPFIEAPHGSLEVYVLDEPSHGWACHRYEIRAPYLGPVQINFQCGAVNTAGRNGINEEALLAIVADRLRGFQRGPFATKANAFALMKIEEALHWLHSRTLDRTRRGVEGDDKE